MLQYSLGIQLSDRRSFDGMRSVRTLLSVCSVGVLGQMMKPEKRQGRLTVVAETTAMALGRSGLYVCTYSTTWIPEQLAKGISLKPLA